MDELTKLAIKHGTDKWGKHHYTPVYYELFKDIKNEKLNICEIGPAEGAGLFMLRDFFPNARIAGLEIDQKRVDRLREEPRITVIKFDQSSLEDIYNISSYLSSVDIIIDDGSHNSVDQIFTMQGIMPYLKKGAYYIIEDVGDDDVINVLTTKFIFDVKVVGDRYDDRLIICQK